jgi:hypothetical protein
MKLKHILFCIEEGHIRFGLRLIIFPAIMRELKFHEKKLLKKVDFLQWKSDQTLHEIKVMRRYHVQNREDYTR